VGYKRGWIEQINGQAVKTADDVQQAAIAIIGVSLPVDQSRWSQFNCIGKSRSIPN